MDFREIFPEGQELDAFVELCMDHKGPMPMFAALRPSEQRDIIEGRCVYRQHGYTPILDYAACQL